MEDREQAGRPRSRRRPMALAGLVAGAALLAAAWAWVAGALPRETVPKPNGYDDLVAAGADIRGDFARVNDLARAGTEELRGLIEKNRDVLGRARIGLGRKSAVALDRADSVQAHMDELNALRSLGRLLACEAALDDREGRTAEAVDCYAGLLRFGRAISSGGIILDRMMEGAVQSPGVEGLGRLVPDLSADDARRLAGEVERLDRDREPVDRVYDRDLAFNLDRGGVSLRIAYTINRGVMQRMLATTKNATEQADRRGQARLRLLAATLALRAYRLDHPENPTPPALDVLVPAYLQAVPADPFGKGPLKFRVEGDAVRVYSVGPDGRDDGGMPPPSKNSSGGDLLLGTTRTPGP